MSLRPSHSSRLRRRVYDDLLAKDEAELGAALGAALHRYPWIALRELSEARTRALASADAGGVEAHDGNRASAPAALTADPQLGVPGPVAPGGAA